MYLIGNSVSAMTVISPGSEPADVFIAIVTKLTVEIILPPAEQIEMFLAKT